MVIRDWRIIFLYILSNGRILRFFNECYLYQQHNKRVTNNYFNVKKKSWKFCSQIIHSSLNSLLHNQPLMNLIEYKNYCYAALFFFMVSYQVVYSTDTHIQRTVAEGRSHSFFRYHFHSVASIQTSNCISVFEIHI